MTVIRVKENSGQHLNSGIGDSISKQSPWKRIKQWLGDYKWPLIVAMWIVTITLGYIGFSKYYTSIGVIRSPFDILYVTLGLFTM